MSDKLSNSSLSVCERFYSIQGESTWAGLPCLFIRLAGCNLRCRWCDSTYSFEKGETCCVAELVSWALSQPCPLVELTGGEPLAQAGAYPLMDQLLAGGKTVLLETNGSVDLIRVPLAVCAIVDVKCPGSGMLDSFCRDNLERLASRRALGCRDEVKFVLADEADFFWALDFVRKHRLHELASVLFSPVRPGLDPERLAALMLAQNAPARLQLQLHTLVWPEKRRGV